MSDPHVVRFIKLLMKRGFVEEIPVTISGLPKKLFRFGPLGVLLRRHILKQWWDAVVLEQPNTYCVDNPIFVPHTDAIQNDKNSNSLLPDMSFRTSLSSDCQAAYLSALNLNGDQLPVSVASFGQCFRPSAEAVPHNSKLLSNGVTETQLMVQHYNPPVNMPQVFDFCLRTRLRWWKHFCSKPSKLSSSSSMQKGQRSEENIEAVIAYEFPWGSEPVERVSSLGDASIRDMETRLGVSHQGKYHRKMFHPHLIECQTSLEQCMSVFLVDSYRERELKKKVESQKNNTAFCGVLHLHSLLAPYQVAMSVTGSRAAEVRALVDRVARELREAGISVLNTPANSGSMDTQYSRNDELGVPYTVVMSDQTLDTGVISIRDRDTRLKQQQHVSTLQSLLSKSIRAYDID